jgi:hypothetical protein
MYSVPGDTTSLVPGFPIRTSSDPRSVDSSPRLIAASHVLHRLPVPRHPPCALKHLQTQKPILKLHIREQQPHPQPPPPPRKKTRETWRRHGHCSLDARNHYPQIKHHTPPPSGATTTTPRQNPGATPERAITASGSPLSRAKKRRGLVVSKPNSVFSEFPPARTPQRALPEKPACLLCTRTGTHYRAGPSNESLSTPKSHTVVGGA